MIYLDFETRSEADLRECGTSRYAEHPSTEPICLCFTVDNDPRVWIWHPGFEDLAYLQASRKRDRTHSDLPPIAPPEWLFRRIAAGELVEAHNAYFERKIWYHVMHKRFGWPDVPFDQWRCSQAKCSTFALRRKLEHVAGDLGVPHRKDMDGHSLMLKLSKPRNPTKGDPHSKYHQKRKELVRVFRYCVADVRAERDVSQSLPEMPEVEVRTWQLDQEMNLHGVKFDRRLATKAIEMGQRASQDMQCQIQEMTGHAVKGVTDRAAMIDWLKGQNVSPPIKLNAKQEEIETTERKGLEKLIKSKTLSAHVERVCQLWILANKASTAKYAKMLASMDSYDYVQELLRYHAASTGRWGGLGVQPQNFPRKVPKNLDQLCEWVIALSYEDLCLAYGHDKIMDILSSILRGSIICEPDEVIMALDFSAIEARGVAWVARDMEMLQAFRDLDAKGPKHNEDIYTWQASQILGRHVTKEDEEARQNFGKVPVLGCGYQMGPEKLVKYAEDMGIKITLEQARKIVESWRKARWRIVNFWRDVEWAAVNAVKTNSVQRVNDIAFGVHGQFLYCRLPSGRLLAYLDPKLEMRRIVPKDPTKKPFDKLTLTYMGSNTYTHQWERCTTYGGKLTENIVQALCRDLLRDSMLRCADAGMAPALTVHDELVNITKKVTAEADFERFKKLVLAVPGWASDLPIGGSGWIARRYRK